MSGVQAPAAARVLGCGARRGARDSGAALGADRARTHGHGCIAKMGIAPTMPTPLTDEQVALVALTIALIGCGAGGGLGEVDAVTADFARMLERDIIYWRDLYDRQEAQLKDAEAVLRRLNESTLFSRAALL